MFERAADTICQSFRVVKEKLLPNLKKKLPEERGNGTNLMKNEALKMQQLHKSSNQKEKGFYFFSFWLIDL